MRNFGRFTPLSLAVTTVIVVSLKLHKHLLHSIKPAPLRYPAQSQCVFHWIAEHIQFTFMHTIIVDFCLDTFLFHSFGMACGVLIFPFFWTFSQAFLCSSCVENFNFCFIIFFLQKNLFTFYSYMNEDVLLSVIKGAGEKVIIYYTYTWICKSKMKMTAFTIHNDGSTWTFVVTSQVEMFIYMF